MDKILLFVFSSLSTLLVLQKVVYFSTVGRIKIINLPFCFTAQFMAFLSFSIFP